MRATKRRNVRILAHYLPILEVAHLKNVSMTQNCEPNRQVATLSQPASRLLRDDSGIMTLARTAAVAMLALAALVSARPVADVLTSYLYRIHIVVTLLMH